MGEHFKQELEELTSQPRVTKNNQARRLAEATQGTETLEMNREDLSNAGDRNALVRDLEDLLKERNALIEEMNDVRRRITPIEDEIEHLEQELAVAKSQPRVTKNNQAPGPSRAHPVCPEPLMAE